MIASFPAGDPTAKTFFDRHGWVLVDTLDTSEVERLRAWVDDVASWPATDDRWLHYRELTDDGPKLCRTENFTPFHAGLRSLLTQGSVMEMAAILLGEEARLYKEKINYKLAGGAGYAPHQDAPAYPFIDAHISCMIAVDDADAENGCLEVVGECFDRVLPMNEVGCIEDSVVTSLVWTSAPVRSGQTLWFHSRTPHRSGPNRTKRDRRALYPTYNALSEGDLRDEYYRTKLALMAERSVGKNVQVSLIGDFQGRPVD
jgi:hypothetical protein